MGPAKPVRKQTAQNRYQPPTSLPGSTGCPIFLELYSHHCSPRHLFCAPPCRPADPPVGSAVAPSAYHGVGTAGTGPKRLPGRAAFPVRPCAVVDCRRFYHSSYDLHRRCHHGRHLSKRSCACTSSGASAYTRSFSRALFWR